VKGPIAWTLEDKKNAQEGCNIVTKLNYNLKNMTRGLGIDNLVSL